MVYWFQLTYDEVIDILHLKYIPTTTIGYSLPPGMYEHNDFNFVSKSSLPKEVKVKVTIDDFRLKSNLTFKKTTRFTKKSFFYIFRGFTHSHLGELGDIEGFIHLMPRSYKSDKLVNITGNDKVHLKCDCNNGSIVNDIQEPNVYFIALSSPSGHKTYKEPPIKPFKKNKKSVLTHIMFYIEGDDHKPLDFNEKIMSFTCQLIKN